MRSDQLWNTVGIYGQIITTGGEVKQKPNPEE